MEILGLIRIWVLEYLNRNFLDVSGTVLATAYQSSSDYRIKHNIETISNERNVDKLNPVEYDLNDGKHDMGFLAHELQEVFPFLVTGEKDGDKIQSINYNGLLAVLVKEIQELKHKNIELNNRINILEEK